MVLEESHFASLRINTVSIASNVMVLKIVYVILSMRVA